MSAIRSHAVGEETETSLMSLPKSLPSMTIFATEEKEAHPPSSPPPSYTTLSIKDLKTGIYFSFSLCDSVSQEQE